MAERTITIVKSAAKGTEIIVKASGETAIKGKAYAMKEYKTILAV